MAQDELKAIATACDGHRFRSRAEARWAVFFNAIGLRYEYEKEGFDLDGVWYLPDFFLPEIGYWLEVKGADPSMDETRLCGSLVKASDKPLLLAVGAPEPREQLLLFPAGGRGPDWAAGEKFYFADDRRNEGEFWLTSEGGGFSIGPVKGPNHMREPGIFSATKQGYAEARAARFEHGEKPEV
jgi:hypothetical protein